MKLRLRSLDFQETVGIEVPDQCSFEHLKLTLLQTLSSSVSADSLHLSLNQKDELQVSSEEDSLCSIGITSGDLVFFTFNSSQFPPRGERSIQSSPGPLPDVYPQDSSSSRPQVEGEQIQGSDFDLKDPRLENFEPVFLGPESLDAEATTGGTIEEEERILESDSEEMNAEDEPIGDVEKKCSKPIFLRRVMEEELGYGDCNAHKLLLTAVHAVLLESGFVLVGPILGSEISRIHMPEDWPSRSFSISLRYTLPQLLAEEGKNSIKTEVVLLKFQSLGNFLNVYGSLSCSKGSDVYSVSLDERKFTPNLLSIWMDPVSSHIIDEHEENPERQVLEFWKIVKDAISFPLLIDLCEKTGLCPPSSFMQLPEDLKLKILESLPIEDIASVQYVCTELRQLVSSNELWKVKFNQKLALGEGAVLPGKKTPASRKPEHRLPRRVARIPRRNAFMSHSRLRGR
ncbi:F-box protein SKIP22-like [Cucurbita moschata]|uniref:F-box protein SKIP22-like n=1 Tax=Cucurbita moschata TaxID=3662 RepID=A0A6J1FPA7_CUCMO|nr:F-box protein SKIP22-like [Cucurbita moschata]